MFCPRSLLFIFLGILLIQKSYCWSCRTKALNSLPYISSCPGSRAVSEVDCSSDDASSYECCTFKEYFDAIDDWHDYTLGYSNLAPNVTCYLGTDTRGYDQEWFRIESTGLPNHIYSVPSDNQPTDQSYDYLIPVHPTLDRSLDEQDICDDDSLGGGPEGFALNGVPFYSPMSLEGYDPINLPDLDDAVAETFDICLGHPATSKDYHYHYFPVCMFSYTCKVGSTTISPCVVGNSAISSTSSTYYNSRNIALGTTSTYVTPGGFSTCSSTTVVGITTNGFLIYGPYDSNGDTIDGLDNCNGKFVNGVYRYHLTETYPYIMGCYGPGTFNASLPSTSTCTSKPPSAYAKISEAEDIEIYSLCTNAPTASATSAPTTMSPTYSPTISHAPTPSPTFSPTPAPTFSPTPAPTFSPTFAPTYNPTISHAPTFSPTFSPTHSPTISHAPTPAPTPSSSSGSNLFNFHILGPLTFLTFVIFFNLV